MTVAPVFFTSLATASLVGRGHSPVLIEGEAGTGKEIVMRAVHAASPRSREPLRIVNVGTVPVNSIESLLFGHEKGAFVGAFECQIGAFQQCDGGTLAIDEIDRLPLRIQRRLVEALTHSRVRAVGAPYGFEIDVRLIAASNRPLKDMVTGGYFLPELLQAISPTTVSLPPLRERPGDIAALCRHFLIHIGEQPGLRHLGITDEALSLLTAYDWPGNIRQLQAVLFRAAVFCDGDALTPGDFAELSNQLGEGPPLASAPESCGVMLYTPDGNLRSLEEIEADVIRLAIGLYCGRMSEIARRLGIGRSTLYRKLSELENDNAAGTVPTLSPAIDVCENRDLLWGSIKEPPLPLEAAGATGYRPD